MKRIVMALVLTCTFSANAMAEVKSWNQTWWNAAKKVQLSAAEKNKWLARSATIVIGEEHYNPPVQAAEAAIIRSVARDLPHKEKLLLGWEFLNTIDSANIESSYARYLGQELSTAALLTALFPSGAAPTEYAPVLEAIRDVDGWLIPTNLTRAQKTPVTQNGIGAADPAILPKDFAMGTADYFERFKEAMGPHPLPYPIENYFASQSLTDEVMATELLKFPTDGRRLLITGSFHGDYRDGVVRSIARRSDRVVYIRILDASAYTVDELYEEMNSSVYGPLADLIHVVNEPSDLSSAEGD